MFAKDLIETLSDYWVSIDSRYKIAFFTALVINITVYLVFIVHQPMHNHGILSRLLYLSPYEQYPAGRWFSVVIFKIFNNTNLMVLLPLVTIVLHCFGGMLSVYLWDKKSKTLTLTAGALMISLYPPVMTSFNFAFVGPVFSGPHVLAPLALLVVSSQRWIRILFGSIIVCLMMATYQPGLSILLTIFMAFFIIKVCQFQGNKHEFIIFLKNKIIPKIIAIAIGGILYKLSLSLLGIGVSQTTTTIGIAEIIPKFILTFEKSFAYLTLTQPELMQIVKITLLGINILAFFLLCYERYSSSSSSGEVITKIAILTLLYLFLVLSTKGMYLVSANNNFWTYRYNHALGYFYMFGFFILLTFLNVGFGKNLTYIVLLFILIKFSYAVIGRQQVLLRAQTHHLAIANRILYRIETLPNINYQKKYNIVRIGRFSEFQSEQLKAQGHTYRKPGDVHLDSELSPIWGPGDIFNYLGSKIKLQGYMNKNFKKDFELAKELVKGHEPWPAKDSVFINENMIIIYI